MRLKRANRLPAKSGRVLLALISWPFMLLSAQPGTSALTNRISGSQSREAIRARWKGVAPMQLRKAAEAGDAEAQYYLGITDWDAARAEDNYAYQQWRLKAATNRPPGSRASPAHQAIGTNWASVPESATEQAADAGDRGAQRYLTRVESDKAMARGRGAFEWLRKAATQSVAPAEFQLAWTYSGLGWRIVTPDAKESLKWLRKAAHDDSAPAQHGLAQLLVEGNLVAPDLAAGIDWLRRAADQGYPPAQFELARQYTCGNGAPRNAGDTPVALLTKAAHAGLGAAQYALAERYRTGLGVPKDYIEAILWYNSAATNRFDRSEEEASQVLALVDHDGRPAGLDSLDDSGFVKALSLYVKALSHRDPAAMSRIGDLYAQRGMGTSNPAKAFFWYSLAAERGFTEAAQKRGQLKPMLSPEDFEIIKQWTINFNRGRQ